MTDVVHLVSAGGWNACDTAADFAGSNTSGVTCSECLEAADFDPAGLADDLNDDHWLEDRGLL